MFLTVASWDNLRIAVVLQDFYIPVCYQTQVISGTTNDVCFFFVSIYAASQHLDLQWISWHLM